MDLDALLGCREGGLDPSMLARGPTMIVDGEDYAKFFVKESRYLTALSPQPLASREITNDTIGSCNKSQVEFFQQGQNSAEDAIDDDSGKKREIYDPENHQSDLKGVTVAQCDGGLRNSL